MLLSFDPYVWRVLVCGDDDADFEFIIQVKGRLDIVRDLSVGVLLILQTYGRFLAQLYQDRVPMYQYKKGADGWHIRFRECIHWRCQWAWPNILRIVGLWVSVARQRSALQSFETFTIREWISGKIGAEQNSLSANIVSPWQWTRYGCIRLPSTKMRI